MESFIFPREFDPDVTSGFSLKEVIVKDVKQNEHKQKALDLALTQIEKQFGKGSIMRLGADTNR